MLGSQASFGCLHPNMPQHVLACSMMQASKRAVKSSAVANMKS